MEKTKEGGKKISAMEKRKRKRDIVTAEELPDETELYFKKDFLGWRIVNPPVDMNGKPIYINILFGGWRNLANLLILLAIFSLVAYGYYHDVTVVREECHRLSEDRHDFYGGVNYETNPDLVRIPADEALYQSQR